MANDEIMQGQISIFDNMPTPCDCGSSDIEVFDTECGNPHSGVFIYFCACMNCGRCSTGRMEWRSTAKTKEEAIREWNNNPRKLYKDGLSDVKHRKMLKEIRGAAV